MCKFRLLHFESVYFLQSSQSLSRLFGGFIQWKISSNDELSSDTSSSCDVESLQLTVEGEGSFKSIVQRCRVGRVVEEGDVTEEDEDDEDGIRFVTSESLFENRETVLNW